MQVTYEKKDAMTFIGYHTRIRMEEGYQKCPEFWDLEYNRKYARLFETMKPETPVEEALLANRIGMFAICADGGEEFDYWIAGIYQGGDVPEGLELYAFPEGTWAVFTAKGPIPKALQDLNSYVWKAWLPSEGKAHQADPTVSLEVYSSGNPQSSDYESAIWMPVRKI